MGWDYKFVASIAAMPTVRLDLKADWDVRDETSWGMPQLDRAVVSSMLVEGEQYPAAAFGGRTITLVLAARNPGDPDAVAAAMQSLVRELDRPSNILMYRPGTSRPVFFRTFRAAPSSVRWDAGRKAVTAEVPAEPFALGLRETLPTATVSNDPAGGMFFDVASPKGDVEAPLFLSVRASDVARYPESAGSGRRQSAIAVRRRGTPSAMPAVLQVEAMTARTDTSAQPASGSSGNVLRTSFATATSLQVRASTGPFPSSPSSDARGQYRVFLRCRKSASTDTVQMQMQYVNSGAYVLSDLVVGPADTVWRWVDMGLVQLPLGYDPVVDGLSGVPMPVGGMTVSVYAARPSGTGTLDLDALMFVPADDRFSLVKWPDITTESAYVVDPVAGQAYGVGAAGEVQAALLEMVGGPPMVSPGVANRVWVLRDVGSTWSAGDDVAGSMQVTPYYWPRYQHVRPVAS